MTPNLHDRYFEDGFIHLEGVFGREEVAAAIEAVRHLPAWVRHQTGNRNVQRVQPLQRCAAVKDPGWIAELYDHPGLDRILDAIFGAHIEPAPRMSRDLQLTALLIEPLEHWWSTGLHRDYRDFMSSLDLEAWQARASDPRLFNQVNIPLLPDTSFWLVPGSHRRDDREDEARMVRARARYADCQTRPLPPDEVDRYRHELIAGLRRCDAVNLEAGPGDLVIYRSNMLHCGLYETAPERLTLHDAVYSSEWHRYVLETFRQSKDTPRAPAAGSRPPQSA